MQVQPGLVSVVIPTYNRAGTIRTAIDSVLAQTYPHTEIIVVDDGSTDETYQLLKTYQQERKIIYLTQGNSGPAAARNHGIKMAHGEFVAFLDADDHWLPEKLAKQMPLFGTSEVGLVYSDMQLVGDRSGLFSGLIKNGYKRGSVLKSLIYENFVPTSTVVARSILFSETSLFLDDRYHVPIGEDYYFWLHLAALSSFDFIDEPLVEYMIHSGQISAGRLESYKSLVFLFSKLLASPLFRPYRLPLFVRYAEVYCKSAYTRFKRMIRP